MGFKLIGLFFLIAISLQSVIAGESSSSLSPGAQEKSQLKNNRDSSAQDIPIITNEAEYATWIKQRERASRTSSTASSKISASKTAKNVSSSSVKN